MSGDPASPSVAPGEEFRGDAGGLSPELVRELCRLDPARGAISLLLLLGTTAGVAAAAVVWWSPAVVAIAALAMTSRQHAMAVAAHEASHYRLFGTRWLNDLVGRMLAYPVGVSMCTYRVVHRLHHNHLFDPGDPDLPLIGGYPRGRGYLLRKLLKDATGITAYKNYAYFFGAPAVNDATGRAPRPLDDTSPRLRRAARRDRWITLAVHAGLIGLAFALGRGLEYLLLWELPLLTVFQALLRFRAVAEHGAPSDPDRVTGAARTNLAPWYLRWIVFPLHVGYHLEHHLHPGIPHYNLPRAHRALVEAGALRGAEIRALSDTVRRVFGEPSRAAS